mmetsp:Transcript_8365/g.10977  ORF Transcript_8365/g.10977 Transcript_8365/m.10977 type:complete len:659 (+) Transcript_8365:81-2057(+)
MIFKLSLLAGLITSANAALPTNLTLLHVNDHHSHLTESSAGSVNIQGDDIPSDVRSNNGGTADIRAYYGGFPRLVTAFQELEAAALADGRDVLKVHAGDAITGTRFFTLFEGDADAKLMTHICFDAFAPGNHEFDNGDAGLARFLTAMKVEADASSTCEQMPAILGANIVPRMDSPLFGAGVPPIEKNKIVTMSNGELVGIIGIDVSRKTMLSSSPDEGTILLDEEETAKIQIANLTALGVNKIVLLTHIGYSNDQAWMALLDGVDVVVGGDSHSLLGDGNTAVFGNTRGEYATIVEKEDGSKTCVVQAWEYSKVIGNLNVDFDDEGNVVSCFGTPIFPLNPDRVTVRDASPRYDMNASDAAVVMTELMLMSGGQAMPFDEDEDAKSDLAVYNAQVSLLGDNVVAKASELIALESRTSAIDSGSCNLVAQGFLLNPLSTADVAIQNRGGCRTGIEEGNFTINDAFTLLPFSNTMLNLIMTGQQIMNVLEDAIDFYLDPAGSTGAYPSASGLRFDVNAALPKGSRVSNLEVNVKLAGSWGDIDMSTNYTVVTNNFIAGVRDGYLEFGNIDDSLKVDTFVEYAQSFINYAEAVESLDPVSAERASTQSYSAEIPDPDTSSPTEAPTKVPTVAPTKATATPTNAPTPLAKKSKKSKKTKKI